MHVLNRKSSWWFRRNMSPALRDLLPFLRVYSHTPISRLYRCITTLVIKVPSANGSLNPSLEILTPGRTSGLFMSLKVSPGQLRQLSFLARSDETEAVALISSIAACRFQGGFFSLNLGLIKYHIEIQKQFDTRFLPAHITGSPER